MASILVIEDDPLVRTSIKFILEVEGYDVVTAGNGLEGMERFTTRQPDLVLTDLIMPEMEGIEVIRIIKERAPAVPVIAMSGGGVGGSSDFLRAAKVFGAIDTLRKPFLKADLLRTVRRGFAFAATPGGGAAPTAPLAGP